MDEDKKEELLDQVALRLAYFMPRETDLYDERPYEVHRCTQLKALAKSILALVIPGGLPDGVLEQRVMAYLPAQEAEVEVIRVNMHAGITSPPED